MIVWINGPFGAGKTSLVERLLPMIPESMLFDPEEVGYMLRYLVPPSSTDDFQDLPIWRSLTAKTIVDVRRFYGKHLLVPMTVVNPGYLAEIMNELAGAGESIRHFFLEIDLATLRRRITEQVMVPGDVAKDSEVRNWRLGQMDRCIRAKEQMPARTIFLAAAANSPQALAEEVLAQIAAEPQPGPP